MKIKGNLFDEKGTSYLVDNVDIYVGEMKDRLLVNTYMTTIYFHEITLAMEELVEKGLAKEAKIDGSYDPTLTENSITSMQTEIIERFDEAYHDGVVKQIDLSFLDKKPKNL